MRILKFFRDLALAPAIWRAAVKAERYRREGERTLPALRAEIATRQIRYRNGFRYRVYEEPILDSEGEQAVLIARQIRFGGMPVGPVLPDRLCERTIRVGLMNPLIS